MLQMLKCLIFPPFFTKFLIPIEADINAEEEKKPTARSYSIASLNAGSRKSLIMSQFWLL